MPSVRLRYVVSKPRIVLRRYHGSVIHFASDSNAFIPYSAVDGSLGAVATISPKAIQGPLFGRKIAIKDNICTTDYPTTCASSVLKGFRSPSDATVVELLRSAGAIINGKTNMDEFGMGSHSVNSPNGSVKNVSLSGEIYSAGGSSGGSAIAVAASECWAALGTDTGGSVRLPAAYTGTFGFKPSYGLISRNGVVAYANSLDTVGIMAQSTIRISEIFRTVSHHDRRDPTSLSSHTREIIASESPKLEQLKRRLRVGVPIEYNTEDLDSVVRQAWTETLQALQRMDIEIHSVSLPSTKSALSAYYVIAPAEASSNLARYDGVRFGNRTEGSDMTSGVLYGGSRDKGFGDEVKRRILLGTYSLSSEAMDNYFVRAQKVRRLVQQDFDRIFEARNVLHDPTTQDREEQGVDVLLCPTAPHLAPRLSEVDGLTPVQAYMTDVMTVPASLAGLPAISIPLAQSEGPESNIGMQLIGQYGTDHFVLEVARLLECFGLTKSVQDEKTMQAGKYGDISPELARSYLNMRRLFGGGMKLVQFQGTKTEAKSK